MKKSRIKAEKEMIYLAFTAMLFLIVLSIVSAVDPGHSLAALAPGTFPAGNYIFPNNLTVNERVGIGTDNPTQKLHVAGNANITGNLTVLGNITVGTGTTTISSSGISTTGTFSGSGSGLTGTASSLSVNYAGSAGSAPASDVSSWAKAANKPSYGFSEIGSTISDAQVPNDITVNSAATIGGVLTGTVGSGTTTSMVYIPSSTDKFIIFLMYPDGSTQGNVAMAYAHWSGGCNWQVSALDADSATWQQRTFTSCDPYPQIVLSSASNDLVLDSGGVRFKADLGGPATIRYKFIEL